MRRMHAWWLASFLAVSVFGSSIAASEDVGIAVGAKAPDFALVDQKGAETRLTDLLAKGPVAIVFYRSADW